MQMSPMVNLLKGRYMEDSMGEHDKLLKGVLYRGYYRRALQGLLRGILGVKSIAQMLSIKSQVRVGLGLGTTLSTWQGPRPPKGSKN